LYIAMIVLNSDIYSGYFVKKRIEAEPELGLTKRIAVIDTSFNIKKFPKENLIRPLNVETKNSEITEVPNFDYSGQIVYSHHGTQIINLFIGKHGLLPRAMIIPIQITSADDLEMALEHAKRCQADIITISLGFAPLHKAFPTRAKFALLETAKKIPILIAAGNESVALENTTYGQSMVQMAATSHGMIWLIGATKLSFLQAIHSKFIAEAVANFSNYPITSAGKSVTIWAPGVNIILGSIFNQIFTPGISGTSIATPLAAIKAIYSANRTNSTLSMALKSLNSTLQYI